MIIDNAESLIVSSLGWIDQGGIWVCETATEKTGRVSLSDAKAVSLHAGRDDHFAVLHHFDGRRIELTAHAFTSPERTLAKLTFADGASSLEGEAQVWQYLPRAYAACYAPEGTADFQLFIVERDGPSLTTRKLLWYDDSYDHGYQGICGVAQVPQRDLLIISVARNSRPVLYDPAKGNIERKLDLADRSGNPEFRFRSRAPEVWVSDYDHLVRLNTKDWSVLDAVCLQDAPGQNALFIGEFAFNKGESLCAVARPYSNDVVGIDTTTFEQTHRAATGGDPIEVALPADNRVFTRDLKTGDLLTGEMKPT